MGESERAGYDPALILLYQSLQLSSAITSVNPISLCGRVMGGDKRRHTLCNSVCRKKRQSRQVGTWGLYYSSAISLTSLMASVGERTRA